MQREPQGGSPRHWLCLCLKEVPQWESERGQRMHTVWGVQLLSPRNLEC